MCRRLRLIVNDENSKFIGGKMKNMKLKRLAIVVCLVMGSQFAMAQVKVADVLKEWERSKAYTRNIWMQCQKRAMG